MSLVFTYKNCKVVVSFLTKVKGSKHWYYKRRIPQDVLSHYPNIKGGQIVKSLRTPDEQQAATVANRITRELENEWDTLRGLKPAIGNAALQGARALLETSGLPPTRTPKALQQAKAIWLDGLEESLPYEVKEALHHSFMSGDVSKQQELMTQAFTPEQLVALDVSSGQLVMSASVMKDEYLRLKKKQKDRKELNSMNPSFEALYECLGDRPPSDYSTYEVQTLVSHMQQVKGWSTGTVKKRMGCLRKTFNYVAKVYDDREAAQHPFHGYAEYIEGLGDDITEREDFTPDQINTLREAVRGAEDELSGLIAVMLDTGLRPSEACGLGIMDMHGLDGEYPFLSLNKTPFRRLKTKNSERFVPLVAEGLAYVHTAKGKWLFPSYVDEDNKVVKNENASIAVNNRLKAILGVGCPTSYSFRHTLTTRLRDVECPQTIQDELQGWATKIRNGYGNPTDIKLKTKYIKDSINWEGQGWRPPRQ